MVDLFISIVSITPLEMHMISENINRSQALMQCNYSALKVYTNENVINESVMALVFRKAHYSGF